MTREHIVKALYNYFGFQGGTKHQLDALVELDVFELESARPKSTAIDSKYSEGWFCARTCGVFVRTKIGELNKGDLDFWIGVIHGTLVDIE